MKNQNADVLDHEYCVNMQKIRMRKLDEKKQQSGVYDLQANQQGII